MWVSHRTIIPIEKVSISDLPSQLKVCGAELKVVDSLLPLRDAWKSSLHVSGIRLRNAQNWSQS